MGTEGSAGRSLKALATLSSLPIGLGEKPRQRTRVNLILIICILCARRTRDIRQDKDKDKKRRQCFSGLPAALGTPDVAVEGASNGSGGSTRRC